MPSCDVCTAQLSSFYDSVCSYSCEWLSKRLSSKDITQMQQFILDRKKAERIRAAENELRRKKAQLAQLKKELSGLGECATE